MHTSYAQTGWYPNANSVAVTPDNIGIGLPISIAPSSKLSIVSTYSITGGGAWNSPAPCAYTGQPGLTVEWAALNTGGQMNTGPYCSNTLDLPNAFEVIAWDNSQSNTPPFNWVTTKLNLLAVDANGRVGINAKPTTNDQFTVGGASLFLGNSKTNGNMQVMKKFSVNTSNTLLSTDWGNTAFPYSFSVDNGNSRFMEKVEIGIKKRIYANDPNCLLSVYGDLFATKVLVQNTGWADYVFAPEYNLAPLADVENYIATNNHLPNMPSAKEVSEKGQDLGEMQKLQQAKIEELTLYIIDQQKQIQALVDKVEKLSK